MDERTIILARNLVHNSCEIKPGEKVWINHVGNATEDIVKAYLHDCGSLRRMLIASINTTKEKQK